MQACIGAEQDSTPTQLGRPFTISPCTCVCISITQFVVGEKHAVGMSALLSQASGFSGLALGSSASSKRLCKPLCRRPAVCVQAAHRPASAVSSGVPSTGATCQVHNVGMPLDYKMDWWILQASAPSRRSSGGRPYRPGYAAASTCMCPTGVLTSSDVLAETCGRLVAKRGQGRGCGETGLEIRAQ